MWLMCDVVDVVNVVNVVLDVARSSGETRALIGASLAILLVLHVVLILNWTLPYQMLLVLHV